MAITDEMLAAKADLAYQEHWGYIWATAGETWTEKKQEELVIKYKNNPEKFSDYEMAVKIGSQWIGHKVTDCSGLIKWAALQLGLKGIYHGSNSMFNKNCKLVAKIEKGTRIPVGAVVFTGNAVGQHNHVGIMVTSTTVCEAKSTSTGVVHTPISNKKWTYYGLLKGVSYEEAVKVPETKPSAKKTAKVPATKEKKYTYPMLRRGDKGDLVTQLQDLLAKDGSTLQVDGIFGPGTQSAVKSFQKRHGLEVDGIVGPKTWAELLKLI